MKHIIKVLGHQNISTLCSETTMTDIERPMKMQSALCEKNVCYSLFIRGVYNIFSR